MRRRDWVGCAVVGAAALAMAGFRAAYVEPPVWAVTCAGPGGAWVCAPRAALLWAQQTGGWGGMALALGVAAVARAPFAVRVAAVATGACAVMNYNATLGVWGAALGAWAWLTPDAPRATAA